MLNRRALPYGLIVLAFVGAARMAAAQDVDRWYVSPFWGSTSIEAESDGPIAERFEGGFQLGARFGYYVTRRIAIEGTYRYSPNTTSSFQDPILGEILTFSNFASHALGGDVRFLHAPSRCASV